MSFVTPDSNQIPWWLLPCPRGQLSGTPTNPSPASFSNCVNTAPLAPWEAATYSRAMLSNYFPLDDVNYRNLVPNVAALFHDPNDVGGFAVRTVENQQGICGLNSAHLHCNMINKPPVGDRCDTCPSDRGTCCDGTCNCFSPFTGDQCQNSPFSNAVAQTPAAPKSNPNVLSPGGTAGTVVGAMVAFGVLAFALFKWAKNHLGQAKFFTQVETVDAPPMVDGITVSAKASAGGYDNL